MSPAPGPALWIVPTRSARALPAAPATQPLLHGAAELSYPHYRPSQGPDDGPGPAWAERFPLTVLPMMAPATAPVPAPTTAPFCAPDIPAQAGRTSAAMRISEILFMPSPSAPGHPLPAPQKSCNRQPQSSQPPAFPSQIARLDETEIGKFAPVNPAVTLNHPRIAARVS